MFESLARRKSKAPTDRPSPINSATTPAGLTDQQLILLSEASRDGRGRISLSGDIRGDAIQGVLGPLIEAELIEVDNGTADERPRPFGAEAEKLPRYRITPAGMAAIGLGSAGEGDDSGVASVASAATRGSTTDAADPASAARDRGEHGGQVKLRSSGKITAVVALLRTESGAGIAELQSATGWQPHTLRAAISRLRQRGLKILTERRAEGGSVYRIAAGDDECAKTACGNASDASAPAEG